MKCCRADNSELLQEITELQAEFDAVVAEAYDMNWQIQQIAQNQQQIRSRISEVRSAIEMRLYEQQSREREVGYAAVEARYLEEIDKLKICIAENKQVIAQQKQDALRLQEANKALKQREFDRKAKHTKPAIPDDQMLALSTYTVGKLCETSCDSDYAVIRQKIGDLKQGLDAQLQIMLTISRKLDCK